MARVYSPMILSCPAFSVKLRDVEVDFREEPACIDTLFIDPRPYRQFVPGGIREFKDVEVVTLPCSQKRYRRIHASLMESRRFDFTLTDPDTQSSIGFLGVIVETSPLICHHKGKGIPFHLTITPLVYSHVAETHPPQFPKAQETGPGAGGSDDYCRADGRGEEFDLSGNQMVVSEQTERHVLHSPQDEEGEYHNTDTDLSIEYTEDCPDEDEE